MYLYEKENDNINVYELKEKVSEFDNYIKENFVSVRPLKHEYSIPSGAVHNRDLHAIMCLSNPKLFIESGRPILDYNNLVFDEEVYSEYKQWMGEKERIYSKFVDYPSEHFSNCVSRKDLFNDSK